MRRQGSRKEAREIPDRVRVSDPASQMDLQLQSRILSSTVPFLADLLRQRLAIRGQAFPQFQKREPRLVYRDSEQAATAPALSRLQVDLRAHLPALSSIS